MKHTFLLHKVKHTGFSLVEVLIAAAIISTAIVAILASYGGLSKLSYRNTTKVQANFLVNEGIEAVRSIRDAGWAANINSLSTTTTYRLYWTGSVWTSTTSVFSVDNTFDRTFTVSSVSRDGGFDIVTSGGTVDVGTRKFRVNVSWSEDGSTSTKSSDFYLFNTFND